MNKKLQGLYNHLEESRRQLIDEFAKHKTAQLETCPAVGKWSVAQIVYHLNQAESVSMNYVRKKMLETDKIKDTGISEAIKLTFLRALFESPVKFKMPENLLGEMPEKADYETVLRNWNNTRADLKQLLESMPEDMLTKNLYKQPGIGRINVYQMVKFMQIHFNRHKRQAKRAIK